MSADTTIDAPGRPLTFAYLKSTSKRGREHQAGET
jgi:hypothetical protein